jgi:hypothetical protein
VYPAGAGPHRGMTPEYVIELPFGCTR